MALTKDDIVEELVTKYKLARREAVDLMDTFIDYIKDSIAQDQTVKIINFGTFFMRKNPQRKRRNIEIVPDSEWRIPSLKTAAALRNRSQRAGVEKSRDVD